MGASQTTVQDFHETGRSQETPLSTCLQQKVGRVGFATTLFLVYPLRFIIDLLHIIWLAVVLQPYARKWPDAISEGGPARDFSQPCMDLFDWQRRMLCAEIVLFSIDPPIAFMVGFMLRKCGHGDFAIVGAMLALVPSYLVRIGLTLTGMVSASNVRNAGDTSSCSDLWNGAVWLFVVCSTLVLGCWVFIVLFDCWRQGWRTMRVAPDPQGDESYTVNAEVMPPGLRRAFSVFSRASIEGNAVRAGPFALWVTYSWSVCQVANHMMGIINAILLCWKYKNTPIANPMYQNAAFGVCVAYVTCILFVTVVSWSMSRCTDGCAYIPLTNTRPFEFLTYFLGDVTSKTQNFNGLKAPQVAFTMVWSIVWSLFFLLQSVDMVNTLFNAQQILQQSLTVQAQVALEVCVFVQNLPIFLAVAFTFQVLVVVWGKLLCQKADHEEVIKRTRESLLFAWNWLEW